MISLRISKMCDEVWRVASLCSTTREELSVMYFAFVELLSYEVLRGLARAHISACLKMSLNCTIGHTCAAVDDNCSTFFIMNCEKRQRQLNALNLDRILFVSSSNGRSSRNVVRFFLENASNARANNQTVLAAAAGAW